jgi:hypothetical protein
MPIIPAGNLLKSVKTGTPYSPAVSFNPDKKSFFDTHITTLGMLAGGPLTTDGVDVTVPSGVSFIQNGIIVTLTAPAIIPIGGGGFPKYVVADNVDETPGSAVTISVLPSVTAPQVLLATLDPNASTIVQVQQISIRALSQRIDSIAVDVEQDDVLVKPSIGTLNAVGPNTLLSSGPGDQADLTVKLDVKESTILKTVRTEELDFLGATVTPTTGNKAEVDARFQVKDETALVNTDARKIDFRGGGVTAIQDGGDPRQVNVFIPAGGSVTGDGLVSGLIDGDGGVRRLNFTAAIVCKDGVLGASFTGTLAVSTNVSGSNRWDLLQWDGSSFSMKLGTPDCPAPDPGNVPVAVVLVPHLPDSLVRSMNKQATLTNPVIVAYYYANGGLHASRVGVDFDPTTSSTVFVDANQMELSLYFPKTAYRYEFNWDTMIKQILYGFFSEGAFINMMYDGTDEDDSVVTRGYLHSDFGVSLDGFEIGMGIHYNRLVIAGSHTLKGRWRIGQISTPERLSQKRRRIWITEMF